METWGFAISFATCQHGNRYKYIHADRYTGMPVRGLILRNWQLVLK